MKNYLMITDCYYYVKEKVKDLSADMNKDFYSINFDKILEFKGDEKEEIISKCCTLPFGDDKRLLVIDITKYPIQLVKTLVDLKVATTQMLMVYYVKDNLDNKSFRNYEKIAKSAGFLVSIKKGVDKKEIKKLIKSSNSKLESNLFEELDNMDVVENDIQKLACVENIDIACEYLSPSFNQNIFQLQNAIIERNISKALSIFRGIRNVNVIGLNIVLLKHFYSLIQMKFGVLENNMHPYRVKILKSEAEKYKELDLIRIVEILLESEINKNTDFEKTLIKIICK